MNFCIFDNVPDLKLILFKKKIKLDAVAFSKLEAYPKNCSNQEGNISKDFFTSFLVLLLTTYSINKNFPNFLSQLINVSKIINQIICFITSLAFNKGFKVFFIFLILVQILPKSILMGRMGRVVGKIKKN